MLPFAPSPEAAVLIVVLIAEHLRPARQILAIASLILWAPLIAMMAIDLLKEVGRAGRLAAAVAATTTTVAVATC